MTHGSQSDGWVQVRYRTGSLTAGTRWFWQVYPAGLTIAAGGTLGLELKPSSTDRVDLYTGGAKTHFLFLVRTTGARDARSYRGRDNTSARGGGLSRYGYRR